MGSLAWVGLGSDGLSSSAYGPEEAFLALGGHTHLAFSSLSPPPSPCSSSAPAIPSHRNFPSGGGGYLVASKLLSPAAGMVSGCALLIDYVLTITISLASAADAIFSFLPADYLQYKLQFAWRPGRAHRAEFARDQGNRHAPGAGIS